MTKHAFASVSCSVHILPIDKRKVSRHKFHRISQKPVFIKVPGEFAGSVDVAGTKSVVQGTPLSPHKHEVPGVVAFAAGCVDCFWVMILFLVDAGNHQTREVGRSEAGSMSSKLQTKDGGWWPDCLY